MSTVATVPAELEAKTTDLVVQAKQVTAITTAQGYEAAIDLGKALRSMKKGIEEFWTPLKQAAHKSWKNLCKSESDMLTPVEGAISFVDDHIKAYLAAEEAKRRESERIAAEALRKQAEADALEAASRLQASGDTLGAENVLQAAISAPSAVVVAPITVPRVAGTSIRGTWKFRIVNPALIPDEYWVVDETKLGQVVRALKGNTRIPGIEVYEDKSVAMRS